MILLFLCGECNIEMDLKKSKILMFLLYYESISNSGILIRGSKDTKINETF